MKTERNPNLRALLLLVAAAIAAVAIWATAAFGAGSSSSESGTSGSSQATYVQTRDDEAKRAGEDCPQESGGDPAADALAAA